MHTQDRLCILSLLNSVSNLKYKMGKEKEQSQKKSESQGMCGSVRD